VKKPRLLIPGPVEAEDDVLEALGAQTLPHYGALWMRLFNETTDYLQRLFQTQGNVLMIPGPGTAAFEAALGSMVPRGEGVVVLDNGFFGARIRQIAERYGIHPWAVEVPWGKAIDPDDLRRDLPGLIQQARDAGKPIRALVVVHHETSTGVLNPLQPIASVAHEFDLPVIVDAIASFGGVPIDVDGWGLDACVGVPNKCVGAPPGVGLLALSERAWQMAEANPAPHGWYLDLRTWRWYIENWGDWHPYPTTMPTNNIAALHAALKGIFATGPEQHFGSIAWAADCTRHGMQEMGFRLYPDPQYAAPVISALTPPAHIDPDGLRVYLVKEHGLMVSGGLGDLKGKILRVGHIGQARRPEIVEALLEGTRQYLAEKTLSH